MENNIKISRIHSSRIDHINLYQDVEPLQENLLDVEEIKHYNCGINTVSNIDMEIEHDIVGRRNVIELENEEPPIQENPRVALDARIDKLVQKERNVDCVLSVCAIAKNVINITGKLIASGICIIETYSIVAQNMKSAPSLNINEFGIACGGIAFSMIVAKVGKYVLQHSEEKLARESKALRETIVKLEIKRTGM